MDENVNKTDTSLEFV